MKPWMIVIGLAALVVLALMLKQKGGSIIPASTNPATPPPLTPAAVLAGQTSPPSASAWAFVPPAGSAPGYLAPR